MSLLNPFKLDGVKYESAQKLRDAKRLKALKGIQENRGIRNKMWNLIANKKQKKAAADELAGMM